MTGVQTCALPISHTHTRTYSLFHTLPRPQTHTLTYTHSLIGLPAPMADEDAVAEFQEGLTTYRNSGASDHKSGNNQGAVRSMFCHLIIRRKCNASIIYKIYHMIHIANYLNLPLISVLNIIEYHCILIFIKLALFRSYVTSPVRNPQRTFSTDISLIYVPYYFLTRTYVRVHF